MFDNKINKNFRIYMLYTWRGTGSGGGVIAQKYGGLRGVLPRQRHTKIGEFMLAITAATTPKWRNWNNDL